MSYNAKNYTEQGGDVTHIGGSLVFDNGAKVEGFPGAANVEMHSQNTGAVLRGDLDAVVLALKNAGVMIGDEWDVDVKDHTDVTFQNLPTENTLFNTGKVTAAIDGTVITITVDGKVSDLKDCDHGSTWGTHKWFAIGIDTDLDSVVGVVYEDRGGSVTLTADDASEATTVGLSAGDFVLYFKAEVLLANGGASFKLSGLGKAKTEYTVKIVESAS